MTDNAERSAMTCDELLGWYELASTLWERQVLAQKKGPAGILAIMLYSRDVVLSDTKPTSAIELLSDQVLSCERLIHRLAEFAGMTIEIKGNRASSMMVQTMRGHLESPMLPDELKRQIAEFLTANQGRWPSGQTNLYFQELRRFVPLAGRSRRENATRKQYELIDELRKGHNIPDRIKRLIAAFVNGRSGTKGEASAWIECLRYYQMQSTADVDNSVDKV